MRTQLSFEYTHQHPLPPGESDEFRTPDALVEHFLRAYSDPGDHVIDPFAGYGTTLAVAERLGRVPHGFEYESDRVDYVAERLEHEDHIRQGDVLDADFSSVPACDCCFTSPPFMEQTDERNPFRNYSGRSSYEQYLDDIETAFGNLKPALAPGARVVIDVVNMKYQGRVTPLAWDIAERVSTVLPFDGEVVINWERDGERPPDGIYGYGYDHSYCLVFTAPGSDG